jgi:hypothetical protein
MRVLKVFVTGHEMTGRMVPSHLSVSWAVTKRPGMKQSPSCRSTERSDEVFEVGMVTRITAASRVTRVCSHVALYPCPSQADA